MTPINQENYFSQKVASNYLSCSQVKKFTGVPAKPSCEAATIAAMRGEWIMEKSKAMLVGSYVDAYFSGTLDDFKAKNPEIYKKDGSLYAEYVDADNIIKTAKEDEFFMKFLQGEKQTILTGEIFGQQFTGKPDFIHDNAIVDLKVMADMNEIWTKDYGKLNFIDAWNYPIQGAIYQELEFQRSGKRKPFYLAVLTKEKYPDKAIIWIPDHRLEAAMLDMEDKLPRIIELKKGAEQPIRCEKCDYCKSTKKLDTIINYINL